MSGLKDTTLSAPSQSFSGLPHSNAGLSSSPGTKSLISKNIAPVAIENSNKKLVDAINNSETANAKPKERPVFLGLSQPESFEEDLPSSSPGSSTLSVASQDLNVNPQKKEITLLPNLRIP